MTSGNDTFLTMNAGYEIDAETELDAKLIAIKLLKENLNEIANKMKETTITAIAL